MEMSKAKAENRPLPKRFYAAAKLQQHDDGFAITLDGKIIRTPQQKMLHTKSKTLAQQIAAEWDAQAEHINADTYIKKLELAIFNSGVADLVESDNFRDKLREERAQQQDFASSATISKWGEEVGADLMLFGEMTSETDVYNKKRVVNYITTLFLTDMETNKRIWYGQEEIKKFIKN